MPPKNYLKYEEYRDCFVANESHALNDSKPLKAKCLLCDGEREISYTNRSSYNLKRHMEVIYFTFLYVCDLLIFISSKSYHTSQAKNGTPGGGKRRRQAQANVPPVF
jgi:hypothetical protein